MGLATVVFGVSSCLAAHTIPWVELEAVAGTLASRSAPHAFRRCIAVPGGEVGGVELVLEAQRGPRGNATPRSPRTDLKLYTDSILADRHRVSHAVYARFFCMLHFSHTQLLGQRGHQRC